MKAAHFFLAAALAMSTVAHAQLSFEVRKDSIATFFASGQAEPDYATATATILHGPDTVAGLELLYDLTSVVSPDIIERFRMTSAWLLTRHRLPDSISTRIAEVWRQFPVRPAESDHEHLLYYTALYLATKHLPAESALFNGRSVQENERDARSWLQQWMRVNTEEGQEEFDSPTYGAAVFTALLMLRDHASDTLLARRADLMAHWYLADAAHDYLSGSFAGAHARENLLSAMQPISSDMTAIAWLYFGDGVRVYGRDQLFASLSSYEPLPEIVQLATNREKGYESWEVKKPASVLRDNGMVRRGPVVKYMYMDPLFAMGSVPGGLLHHREQHSWDVTWTSANPELPATLFLMQPFSDVAALLPFVPHTGEIALRNTSILDPYFPTVTRMVGGSPYEDVFQYRNTLIALYDIPQQTRFPVVTGFLPPADVHTDIDSLKSGWITLRSGDVYIGFYPFKPYRLADGVFGRHFISQERVNGALVYVTAKHTVGSYEQFLRKLRATRPDLGRLDTDKSVSYTTITGDVLRMSFAGERTVNGASPPAPPSNTLFSSPWLHSVRGSGVLTIKGDASEVAIDMGKMELRRSVPAQHK